MVNKNKKKKVKKKILMSNLILKGRCLKCKKPMFRNHKSCRACNRKARLKSKANRRGKKKNYYLTS